MSMKQSAAFSKSVNVWRIDVCFAVAIQLGSKIVDTQQQDVGLFVSRRNATEYE